RYSSLNPLIVHADGHSFDDTLSIASHIPLPPSVRRLATRYQGLPGKGSALRVIFEIASRLQARALLLIEADVISLEEHWIPLLLDPILANELDVVLPIYQLVRPSLASADLIVHPVISAMYHLPLRYPTGGEVAMAGGVAAFFAEHDVWETDVARDGIDIWMVLEVALEEGRMGQVHLGPKIHRSNESTSMTEAKFLQEIGTLFRMALLHEKSWRQSEPTLPLTPTLTTPSTLVVQSREGLPDPLQLWRNGKRAMRERVLKQWQSIMSQSHLAQIEALLEQPDESPQFDEVLWARLIYDFIVVYNLGEGDPDKVITSLYPLFLLRHAALLAQSIEAEDPEAAREALIQRQCALFQEELEYLFQRWSGYVSPEQIELWRELGILPN
ncbi:MAG: hypothetical protein H0T73_22475, partial [Ardenticatenales bacterium]|nr:hypothetical protein [Ardenticatenales bacterium]